MPALDSDGTANYSNAVNNLKPPICQEKSVASPPHFDKRQQRRRHDSSERGFALSSFARRLIANGADAVVLGAVT